MGKKRECPDKLTVNLHVHIVNKSSISLDGLDDILAGVQGIWGEAHLWFRLLEYNDVVCDPWPPRTASDFSGYAKDGEIHCYIGYWPEGGNGFNVRGTPLVFIRDHRINVQMGGTASTKLGPPLERVIAHEIGHVFLGPDHSPDASNLMSTGKEGIGLTPEQVVVARKYPGATTGVPRLPSTHNFPLAPVRLP